MNNFLDKIESLSKKVFKQLSGLKEEHFQTALGVEFRKNKIDFMREAGLELFMIIILSVSMNSIFSFLHVWI